jgi:hypothetical protein
MIGAAELMLFLSPFVAYAVWRLLGPRVTPLYLGAALLAVLAIAATGLGLIVRNRVDRRYLYVPAHMENGVIVPGHAVPRR